MRPIVRLGHVRGLTPDVAAQRLAERGFATWSGNYYAVEVMKRLGLPDGGLRIGFVHYNTADEVDRLLESLERIASSAVATVH